jgi:predicted Rossmann fold flavoprotein
MLLNECLLGRAEIVYDCKITNITKSDFFSVETNLGNFKSRSLVIASGGLSITKLGASSFGYEIAKKFGLSIIEPRPALVPLVLGDSSRENFAKLSGISIAAKCSYKKTLFSENILFTHRGLSGPAILQISSYIENPHGQTINVNLIPNVDLIQIFLDKDNVKSQIGNMLKAYFANKFVMLFCELHNILPSKIIAEFKKNELIGLVNLLSSYPFLIQDTEGYNKAEVTAGGIDTNELSSKTMEVKKVPNLYFIGEVVDVTGWLGGYNFQWAWSSGFVAGSNIL